MEPRFGPSRAVLPRGAALRGQVVTRDALRAWRLANPRGGDGGLVDPCWHVAPVYLVSAADRRWLFVLQALDNMLLLHVVVGGPQELKRHSVYVKSLERKTFLSPGQRPPAAGCEYGVSAAVKVKALLALERGLKPTCMYELGGAKYSSVFSALGINEVTIFAQTGCFGL